jgi:hypothetical protein
VAIGNTALNNLTTGSRNTAVGYGTLRSGNFNDNTAVGWSALLSNTLGINNTAVGSQALLSNTEGPNNTAVGVQALAANTTGNFNTANGAGALFSNTEGIGNTAIGGEALESNTTGDSNIALGGGAGGSLTTGSGNINIGFSVSGPAGESNTIRIGDNLPTGTGDSACFIGGIRGQTATSGVAVFVTAAGKLGTVTSSARFKDEIKPMDKASEAILALRPVTFRYKQQIDPMGIPQFGLVAEDVEKVNPDLVVRDDKGEIYTVRYEAVNAMLLNEFLKEHQKVQRLEATV